MIFLRGFEKDFEFMKGRNVSNVVDKKSDRKSSAYEWINGYRK